MSKDNYGNDLEAHIEYLAGYENTLEVLPHENHYRNSQSFLSPSDFRQRPTLRQLSGEKDIDSRGPTVLHDQEIELELQGEEEEKDVEAATVTSVSKFGWIQGVLVRCLLNIFGVMLFLRLTWITGQAGIGLASVVILLSTVVTLITTTSMSAICTNGEVQGGGAYYMISRSLGPEFGGSIGIVFSFANAVAAAMYVVGFAETVRDLMWEYGAQITGDSLHEVRIIGCATAVLLLGIVMLGMEWEAKAQLIFLLILICAIINYFVGTFIPPSDDKMWKGYVGYRAEVFQKNFGPDFRDDNSFFLVFAIFFPAATGILAGANISGDLKNPQVAIPKGTFVAILLTSAIYITIVWSCGSCLVRDAIGPLLSTMVNTTLNETVASPNFDIIQDCALVNGTCKYGLQNDNGAVGVASGFRPFILAGIFSATLSSALASMVGAPKVFQALGKDKLFPGIKFFSKGYGKGGEPRRGYFLTFAICIGITCIGALDIIAPIISNFFLMAYALINFSCFDASLANSPGFRPGFRFYNKWISFLGSLLCIAVMFLINWWAALVTFVVVAGLYFYIRTKKPDVNWGSSTQAHAYRDALRTTLKLTTVEEHVKNFRPQILVLSGFPRNRPVLIDFVSAITKKQSLLVCGQVFEGDMSQHAKHLRSTAAYKWFKRRGIRAFYNSVATPTMRIGSQVLLQAVGVGKLRPNTVIIGYKSNWQKDDPRDVFDYYNILLDAFDLHYGVGVLRVPEGFDVHKVSDEELDVMDESDDESGLDDDDEMKDPDDATADQQTDTPHHQVDKDASTAPNGRPILLQRLTTLDEGAENTAFEHDEKEDDTDVDGTKPNLVPSVSVDSAVTFKRFREKQFGTIDVWWLFDDGGLTLLIPYILSTRKHWKGCKLRVFIAGTKKTQMEQDQMRMATLLRKFRIDYSQLTVIPDMWKKPKLSTYKEFATIIHSWRLRTGEYEDDYPWKINDADLLGHKQKTYRNLRLREQLLEHSKEAALVVVTLPMPRKLACPAGLYMGWLEMLTKNMPPILLLRGNQQSVLTYYS